MRTKTITCVTAAMTSLCIAGTAIALPAASSATAAATTASAATVENQDRFAQLTMGGEMYSASGKPMVYLTYDDGPDPGSTQHVLAMLRKHRIKGTFFVLGQFMNTAAERQTVRSEFKSGHSVSIHGINHDDLENHKAPWIANDFRTMKSVIQNLTGNVPTCMRPPGGFYTKAVLHQAKVANLRVQMWSADSRDWQGISVARQMAKIRKAWRPGVVILLHDGRGHGANAAEVSRQVIAVAQKRGYQFGQLCPMIKPGQTPIPLLPPINMQLPPGILAKPRR